MTAIITEACIVCGVPGPVTRGHPALEGRLCDACRDRVLHPRTCRVCGCSDLTDGCEAGCWWVADDLCSRCEGEHEV